MFRKATLERLRIEPIERGKHTELPMPETDPLSTDFEVASPAFIDKENVEGDYSASSIRRR